jgi:deoxyribose-phosphate aldolase
MNKASALRILQLMDLTALNDNDSAASIAALAASAATPFGHPAALCIYPQFIAAARAALTVPAKIATVANFPLGANDAELAARECAAAVALGADEVDVVFPWRALLAGDMLDGLELVQRCRAAVGDKVLKVIIESGELENTAMIRLASEAAIEGGADFIKTSTGKMPRGADLGAAATMLAAIYASSKKVGFKASGGVRSVADAQAYLDLADSMFGAGWATPATMRFGASSLLADVLAVLQDAHRLVNAAPY